MSGQQHQPILDPRLGATTPSTAGTPSQQAQYERPQQQHLQPAQAHRQLSPGANNSYSQHTSSQPYYHNYPTPQGHTPQHTSVGPPSSASQSNQPSPAPPPARAFSVSADNERDHESPDAADGNGLNADDAKRPRACEACRGLKVRCDQDLAHPELPCRRCQKAGRQCIITAPNRKRQKKSDGRVAELEKKLDQLTAVLQQQQQQQPGYSQYSTPPQALPADMMRARSNNTAQSQYSQQSSASPRPISVEASSMQPPQKRRRTEGPPQETESLDGAGVANATPVQRYFPREDSPSNIVRQNNEPWANVDSMRNLIHRSPEEFMNRISQLVSGEISISIFNRYVSKLAPHMPAVVFPANTTADKIRRERPILYVCILSATSAGILHPDTAKELAREAIRAIADCVVCNGAKSLELIQAMQVLALWYKPPEKAEQTNFYQLIHMAAVMSIDIGLGKRFNAAKSRRGFGGPHQDYAPGPHLVLPQNSDLPDARRAWLCCYYLCASASMVLRRPNLLKWSPYMKECVDILETSPEALPSDKLFCQHIRVQHICEEIGQQFLMDDNTATISITDPKVSYALHVLENDLKVWVDNIPAELRNDRGLEFFKHVASLYLHEIALHFNHNVEDFRLPFTEESLKAVNNTSETLTQNQMAALESCRKAAQGILDTMLTFDVDTVKTLPMLIFFVRCTYALVILIKMHVAITTPGSEIGKIMSADEVRVDYYIDKLMALFSHVASEQEFRQHPKILRILSVLRDWFLKHKENLAAQVRGDQAPHPTTAASQQGQQEQTNSNRNQANQTPLHVLSQLATGDQSQQQGQEGRSGPPPDWTFNSPLIFDYGKKPPLSDPANTLPNHQPRQAAYSNMGVNEGSFGGSMSDQYNMDGQIPAEYLWGSGFEQAMEINLGDMAGLSNNGMDGLFLGGGMGPFSFHGDAGGGQW